MSNYMRLGYCKRCSQMTNHWYMDATPREGLYTIECAKCGHRPMQGEEIQGSAVWQGVAIPANLIREVSENE